MAKLSELQSQDTIELRENYGGSKRSHEREDSDTAALRQAGKNPVLKVRRRDPLQNLRRLMTVSSATSAFCRCSALAVWSWAHGKELSCRWKSSKSL